MSYVCGRIQLQSHVPVSKLYEKYYKSAPHGLSALQTDTYYHFLLDYNQITIILQTVSVIVDPDDANRFKFYYAACVTSVFSMTGTAAQMKIIKSFG